MTYVKPGVEIGRPSVLDDGVVRKLDEAFRQGFSVSRACEVSDISRSTYYKHLAENTGFSDKMALAQQWVSDQARLVVVKAIEKGDLASAKWWLERKARDEFGVKGYIQPTADLPQENTLDYIKEIAEAIRVANKDILPAHPPGM